MSGAYRVEAMEGPVFAKEPGVWRTKRDVTNATSIAAPSGADPRGSRPLGPMSRSRRHGDESRSREGGSAPSSPGNPIQGAPFQSAVNSVCWRKRVPIHLMASVLKWNCWPRCVGAGDSSH